MKTKNSVANTPVRFGLLTNCIYFGQLYLLWPTVFTLGLRRYEIIHSSINTKAKKTTKTTHLLEQRLAKPIKRLEGTKRTQQRNTCAPATAFWLVDNSHTTWSHQNLTRLFIGPDSSVLAIGANQSLRGIYITLGYTFWSSIGNFSAYSRVLRGSILLPPRHPSIFARMARWQLSAHNDQMILWRAGVLTGADG